MCDAGSGATDLGITEECLIQGLPALLFLAQSVPLLGAQSLTGGAGS